MSKTTNQPPLFAIVVAAGLIAGLLMGLGV